MKSKKSLSNFWKDPIQLHGNKQQNQNQNNSNNNNQNNQNIKEGQLFGVHLNEIFKRYSTINNIPNIIYHISKNIRENGLNEEGIFRIPGSNTQLQQLKKLYNEGKISSKEDLMTKVEDIHTQASLLKLFIRELPDPLFTFALYDSFVKSHMAKDKVVRVGSLKALLGQLPLAHYSLLKFLAELLRDISSLSHKNKMTSSNLAIIFGPTVMRPQQEDGVKMIEDARHVNGIFLLIIDEYDFLFNNNEFPSFVGGNNKSATTNTSKDINKKEIEDKSNSNSISSSPSSFSKRNAGKFNIGNLNDEISSDFDQQATMIPVSTSSSSTPTGLDSTLTNTHNKQLNSNMVSKNNNKFSILLPSNSNSQVLPVSPTHHRNSPSLSPLPPASPRSSLTLENSPDSNPDIIRTLIKKTCMLLFDKDLPNILTDHYEISKDEIYLPAFDLNVLSNNINNDSPRNSLNNSQNNSNSPRQQRLKNSNNSSSNIGSPTKSKVNNNNSNNSNDTSMNPLEIAFSHLVNIRKENKRPSDLNLMTVPELNDEKAAIKKELREFDLTFNSQNGYLPRRNEKEIMRPLYQRYREVKNMIEHKSSINNNGSKNHINENVIDNVNDNSNSNSNNNNNIQNNNIEMGTSSGSSGGSTNSPMANSNLISTSFGSTSVTPLSTSSSLKNSSGSILSPLSETPKQSSSSSLNNSSNSLYSNSNIVYNSNIEYSKMNREQLKERYHLVKTEKRTLQIELHKYQSDFMKKHGRKLQFVEDREPVQVQYTKYKDLKSELSTIEKYLAYTSGSNSSTSNNQTSQQNSNENNSNIPLHLQK
ncbi:hypothetical protein CYY_005039 [Polysphondylium violaceum]|uniref:Rho-GAP domain-containing protein n=1 Tax=Polysphondylium violaceum TaxID=133409 RepID=A0A8J4PVS7_9MYCE|nr:hypothetical protein CYY_005039 [Polysphondylium violaceum]